MKKLLSQNSKMLKTSMITGIKTKDFPLPAKKTCPQAGACLKYCYASKGAYGYPVVKKKFEENLKATKKESFVTDMISEIKRDKVEAVRMHSSGDFYSATYFKKWIEISRALPDVTFYAYTKSITIVRSEKLPKNLTIIFSFGGKQDALINVKKDRHALIFKEKLPSGYAYANDNDHIALASNKKIALKLH